MDYDAGTCGMQKANDARSETGGGAGDQGGLSL